MRAAAVAAAVVVAVVAIEAPTIAAQQGAAVASLSSRVVKNEAQEKKKSRGFSIFVRAEEAPPTVENGAKGEFRSWMIATTLLLALVLSGIIGAVWGDEAGREDDDDKDASDVKGATPSSEVEVSFSDISLKLSKKSGDRYILDGSLSGTAKPGRMLAIMGPSGSGKTSILNALAGRIKASPSLELHGRRFVDGNEFPGDAKLPAAFIEQSVTFFPHMTVRETLQFRVELKLGRKLGKSARDQVVQDLMESLNLVKVADTIVGDQKVRGISGGERKRLSIACEMISSPPIILLDEPTSGLDSFQAAQVIETMRKLANSGKTIIAVIHQPSQHVFGMFDDLLLVSEGKLMYFGAVKSARSYFSTLGYPPPAEVGTAEHVLDCISRVSGSPEVEQESDERLAKIAKAAATKATSSAKVTAETDAASSSLSSSSKGLKRRRPTASILRQFVLLLSRSLRETVRGKAAIIIKVVQQVTLGLVYGGIYQLGDSQSSIQDRVGLISLIILGGSNMATVATIRAFTKEKAVVSSEMESKMYSTLPYFLAKAISEVPLVGMFNAIFGCIVYPMTGLQKGKFGNFLGLTSLNLLAAEGYGLLIGSFSPTTDVALAIFPLVIVLNFIFDGKNIALENIPKLLRWIPKVGLIKWSFEGLALNEFEGLTFSTSGPRRGPVVRTGDEALDRVVGDRHTLADVFQAQANIVAACWFLSYVGLSLTKQKFQVMKVPS